MEIPIDLFLGGIAVSIAIGIFGFIRNPQIPAMLCFGGAFVLLLSVSTTSILMDAFSSGMTGNLYAYNVESRTGTNAMNTGGNIAFVEFVSASNSVLIGDTIDCIDVYMTKVGNPPSTLEVGVMDGSSPPVMVKSFGTRLASTLTTSSAWYSFCLVGNDTYTIVNGDRIGVIYNNGDAVNQVVVNGDSGNPFDGTITFQQFNNGVTWTSQTPTDRTQRMYLSGGDFEITQDPYEFTELPKTFFALIGGTMILLGALMVIKE